EDKYHTLFSPLPSFFALSLLSRFRVKSFSENEMPLGRRRSFRTSLLFLAAGTVLLVIAWHQARSPASGTESPPEVARLVEEAAPAATPAAIRHLEAAVAADGRYVYARYELGRAYSRSGRWKEAAASLEAAVALKPAYREAHYALGQALLHLGRREDARRALQQFRTLDVARREQRSRNDRRRAGAGPE